MTTKFWVRVSGPLLYQRWLPYKVEVRRAEDSDGPTRTTFVEEEKFATAAAYKLANSILAYSVRKFEIELES